MLYLRKFEEKELSVELSPLSFIGMESGNTRAAQFAVTTSPTDATPLITAAVSNKPIKINGRWFSVSSFGIISATCRHTFIVSPVIRANRDEDEGDE